MTFRHPFGGDSKKPRIAVDWDGTFVENAYPLIGTPNPGAVEAMLNLQEFTTPVIFTSRIAEMEPDEYTPRMPHRVMQEKAGIRKMLDDHGLHGVEVWSKPWKPFAVAYIDDRALWYPGRPGSWKAMVEQVKGRIAAERKR